MLSTQHLDLPDKLLVSLALLDWDQAEALHPRHPMFSIEVPEIQVHSIGGAFPTQAEGRILDVPFYFRARHGDWSLGFGDHPISDPELSLSGEDDTAGMMEDEEVMALLTRGARLLAFVQSQKRDE